MWRETFDRRDPSRHRRLTVLLVLLGLCLMLSTRCADYLLAEQGPLDLPGESPNREWRAGPLARSPRPIVAESQGEAHTCGYHALAAVYRSFGRNPVACRIRFRLGVDITAVPGVGDTRGTLPPDLLRVVAQDGFHHELVDPRSDGAGEYLARELGPHRPALLLERREETGGLHWVVGDAVEHDTLRIKDSLQPDPRFESVTDYLATRVASVILLRPRQAGESEPDFWAVHRTGVAEMKRVRTRLQEEP